MASNKVRGGGGGGGGGREREREREREGGGGGEEVNAPELKDCGSTAGVSMHV